MEVLICSKPQHLELRHASKPECASGMPWYGYAVSVSAERIFMRMVAINPILNIPGC